MVSSSIFQSLVNEYAGYTFLVGFLLVIGSTRIALLSISTITMMYLLPRCDLVGNCPVWSVNMVSLVL